ncbi:helix-turn-helix transcriptional regulator [Microbacterium rhizomatis]|uniref:WYL domain-containing protein n=1 Tax=Microbacterium rhizomatis TaxID=1631477 RepID=A0A5J5IZX3_9MICO|nr:WYL domain-containing protein [Microbacterium rhizomatis]KAA9107932.1 WYL domain-containing protein [Microbacterium rhizomatis]
MPSPSSRMLALLSLLQVRREWAGDVLADRLEVSPRTVRRDIDRLRELGYTIEATRGPAGGYRLSSGAELPPLLFDDDQAVAVALALAVAPASGADIAEAAARALATMRQVMPSRIRHRVEAIDVLATHGDPAVSPEVLVAVSEAASAHEILRFDYASAWGDGEAAPPLRVEPHAVIAANGRWYLLAWNPSTPSPEQQGRSGDDSVAAGDWRTYRIDRMRPRAPTRLPFTPRPIPGRDPVAFVAARFRGSTSTAWPCVGTAVLHLSAREIAPYLDSDSAIEEQDEGCTTVTMGSWSWRALAARFAGFDADLSIVGPQQLKDAAIEVGERLIGPTDPDRRKRALRGGVDQGTL